MYLNDMSSLITIKPGIYLHIFSPYNIVNTFSMGSEQNSMVCSSGTLQANVVKLGVLYGPGHI